MRQASPVAWRCRRRSVREAAAEALPASEPKIIPANASPKAAKPATSGANLPAAIRWHDGVDDQERDRPDRAEHDRRDRAPAVGRGQYSAPTSRVNRLAR